MVADKAIVGSLSGDPRRPDLVVPYPQRAPAEEPKLDAYSTVGMVLATLGVFTKARIFSFMAIAFIASAFIQRGPDTDTKQLLVSGMMSVMGIVFSQLQVVPPGAGHNANATAAAATAAAGSAGAAGGQS